jgi:SNF2 family DNA or RNA helicase
MAHLFHVKNLSGPILVVVPLTVLFNWMNELKKFCPQIKVLRMHSSDPTEQLRLLREMRNIEKAEVVLTTYDMLKQGGLSNSLKRVAWRCCILDEGN